MTTAPQQIAQFLRAVATAYPERERIAAAICLASVARSNCLLIGPPGSAKTALAVRTLGALFGERPFSATLSPYATDDQLLGPVDLAALQSGEVRRAPGAYLPDARAAFLDEVSRGSPAVRALLLSALADREIDGQPIPLECAIGATNFVMGDEQEAAFLDRFAVKIQAPYLESESGLDALLSASATREIGAGKAPDLPALGADVLPALRDAAAAATIPPEVLTAVRTMALNLRAESDAPKPSDRRLVWLLDHLRARCAMTGRAVVNFEDLSKVAPLVLAADEGEAALIAGAVRAAMPPHLDALEQFRKAVADSTRAAREVADRFARGESVSAETSRDALNARAEVRDGCAALVAAHPAVTMEAEQIRDTALGVLAKSLTALAAI